MKWRPFSENGKAVILKFLPPAALAPTAATLVPPPAALMPAPAPVPCIEFYILNTKMLFVSRKIIILKLMFGSHAPRIVHFDSVINNSNLWRNRI